MVNDSMEGRAVLCISGIEECSRRDGRTGRVAQMANVSHLSIYIII